MSDRCFVATRKGLFTVDRKPGGWKVTAGEFIGDNLTIVTPDPRDNSVYVSFEHGHFGAKLKRSRDGGRTWADCPEPKYPERPAGAEEEKDGFGKTIPWSTQLIWELTPGSTKQPGVLWAGTIPGGLFRSNDGGETWTLIRTLWDNPKRREWFGGGRELPGIHSIVIDPRSDRHVILGVSCGGVWQSKDAGETWECTSRGMWAAYMPPERKDDPNIQDPHRIVQCAANPDAWWCQHHNGCFRSTDGGQSWTEVTTVRPSTFGFAVVVHPRDPSTAWYVPAIKDEKRVPVEGRVVVARTRDGGRSFQELTRGLPQEHAYDLIFRHALDIDASGDCLALGSTTGSLWVSEDQGDSWQCVSNYLPPIHCVRFVK